MVSVPPIVAPVRDHVPTTELAGEVIVRTNCDRCIQEARVEVRGPGGFLHLCKHHFEKLEHALAAAGYFPIRDRRDELVSKP